MIGILETAALPAPERYGALMEIFSAKLRADLYTPSLTAAIDAPQPASTLLGDPPSRGIAGLQRLDARTYLPDDLLVLGCDSVLELDGEVHGKPADDAEAIERWRRMRGRSGVLHTGHWLVDLRHPDDGGTGGMVGGTASTTVHFADLDDE